MDTEPKKLGNFSDMEMVYKDSFLETLEKGIKNITRFYAIIEDNIRTPIGVINSIEVMFEIGLLIAEDSSRGNGIGTECIRLFVNYLFKTKNIMRIQYTTKTDNIVLGVVTDLYKIIQNKEAFAFTDSLIGEGCKFETAGSLQEGKKSMDAC